MEAEKIKTDLLRMLKDFMYGAPTNLEIFADKVINLFESKFKQPPVSVMPSEEEILEKFLSEMRVCPCHIKHNERVYELGDIVKTLKKCLSLSKEAPKEQESLKQFCECMIPHVSSIAAICIKCNYQIKPEPPSKERETAIEFAKFILQNKSNKPTLIDLDASYINFIKYRNDT